MSIHYEGCSQALTTGEGTGAVSQTVSVTEVFILESMTSDLLTLNFNTVHGLGSVLSCSTAADLFNNNQVVVGSANFVQAGRAEIVITNMSDTDIDLSTLNVTFTART